MSKIQVWSVQEQETKPTTAEDRRKLQAAGFVHVTGVPYVRVRRHDETPGERRVIGDRLQDTELGAWGVQNSVIAIVTPGGECWIALLQPKEFDGKTVLNTEMNSLITALAPKGKGAYVPLSRGEETDWRYLLSRFRDPSADPNAEMR